jgi:hypothetical protein
MQVSVFSIICMAISAVISIGLPIVLFVIFYKKWTCSITRLLIEQVLQNALHFAVFQRKLFKN